jgi:hypothetical protein
MIMHDTAPSWRALKDDRDYYRAQRDRWKAEAEARAEVLRKILAHEATRNRASGYVGNLARGALGEDA